MSPIIARFWSKVDKTPGCWNWNAGRFKDGYGGFYDGHSMTRAHRFSYEIHIGEIPSGQLVCHTCDNPLCVRPKHLFLSDNAGNLADMARKDRSCHGVRNARAKHSPSVVLKIKRIYARGRHTLTAVSDLFDIPRSTVHAIVSGIIWRRIRL